MITSNKQWATSRSAVRRMSQESGGAPRGEEEPVSLARLSRSWKEKHAPGSECVFEFESPPPRDTTVCACAQTVLAIRSLLTVLLGRPQVGLFDYPIDTVRPPSAGQAGEADKHYLPAHRTKLPLRHAPKSRPRLNVIAFPSEKSNLTSNG